MKFTEEQYRQIVKVWNEGFGWEQATNNVIDTVRDMRKHAAVRYGEALALGNPVTREWAHEQFVEKEKRYVWRLKDKPEFVISKSSGAFFLDADPFDKTYFTETEIENSPFKPEWFDKEEVE